MKYGSVCSGIEAATIAWRPLGWTPAWFSEIAPFPCRLLAHHYPHVPNLGDMVQIEQNETFQKTAIDLLVGGTPCQSFSTAGLRRGLADARGNLALEFCRILAKKRPRWFIWENVPGVFSVEEGEAFRSILAAFSDCGYSLSWRVLDAQFFGVPQQRRRVLVVGHIGDDWRPPAAVLFEPEIMRRDSTESGEKGKDITGTIGRRTDGRSIGAGEAEGGMLIARPLTSRSYADNESREANLVAFTLRGTGFDASDDGTRQTLVIAHGQPNAEILEDRCPTLNCNHEQPVLVYINVGNLPCVVRRITPMECERLQGFPDNFTSIPKASDSARYEALGNSMAVPVMHWIGSRIQHIDKMFS